MARGWESKSIESQQADRQQSAERGAPPPEEAGRRQSRETLELALVRARKDLIIATHVAHKSMLEAAIGALEEQLRAAR
jgi:hypothetical protein